MAVRISLAACAVALVALRAVLGVDQAGAQTASQITPPTFRPDLQRIDGAVVFTGEPGLEAPPGAERLTVTISGLTVEGGFPDMAPAAAAVERRLVGRVIPVAEIFAAAQDLEEAYAQAGYVLARVVLPAQRLEDGDRLRLVVVDGFVEEIVLDGVPGRVQGRIGRVVAPLRGERGLTLREIERRLLIAGDTPGVALSSALTAGETPGGTVLIVDGQHRPVTGFVGVDNTLADELGEWVLSAGVEANALLGFGEVLYLRASGHPGGSDAAGLGGLFDERPRVRILAGGAVVPIGADGLSLNLEATRSKETPKPTNDVQTASTFERYSLRLRHPWVRSRALDVDGELVFDALEEEVVLLLTDGSELPLSRDRLRVLRAAGDAVWSLETGAVASARALASFGLDAFGARSGDGVPLSRGAEPSFQKLEVTGSYAQPLGERLGVSFYARAQTSFGQVMPSSERFGIASFGELSTFDAGSIGGDSGWVVRSEVRSPTNIELGAMPFVVTPYAYAATGALKRERPADEEASTLRVSSLGAGLTVTRAFDPVYSSASLTLEYGRGFRDDDEPDSNRFTLVGSFRF